MIPRLYRAWNFHALFGHIVHYLCHHHLRIILVSSLLSLFSGYLASRLSLKTDLAELIPANYSSVRTLDNIKKQVGRTQPLMVVITGNDLEAATAAMLALAAELKHNPYLSSVSPYTNRTFFLDHRLLYMDLADLKNLYTRLDEFITRKKLEQSPLYVPLDDDDDEDKLDLSDLQAGYSDELGVQFPEGEYYQTNEKNGVILRVYPAGDSSDIRFANHLLDSIEETVRRLDLQHFDPSLQVSYSGSFVNHAYDYNMAIQDTRSAAIQGIVGVLLLIMLYFRQVFAPLFIIMPLVMSLTWTFGLTYLVIGSLNQITMVLFAILFGLGIDFGIHIFARYREARLRGHGVEQALTETVYQTGRALITTTATTALAFYSLVLTDFKGFSQFGFIAGTGIVFSLVSMLIVCPAFIILAERLDLIHLERRRVPRGLLRRGAYPLPRFMLVLALVATCYSLYQLKDLAIEYNFTNLRFPPPPLAHGATLPEVLIEERSPAIVLTETREAAGEVVQTVERTKENRGESSTVLSVKSVRSALPEQQPAKLKVIDRIRALLHSDAVEILDETQRAKLDSLEDLLEVKKVELKDLPEDILKLFRSKDGRILNFVTIYASVPLQNGRNARRFADEVGEIRTSSGKTYHASSSNIILADIMQVMISDARMALLLTLVIVFLVVWLDFHSFFKALLVLTPLIVGLLWLCGFMHLFDLHLNLYNMVIFPTLVGMGVDNGVHILHRYQEEGAHSLRLVLRTTGMALLATSLTTIMGFSGLVFGHHPGLTSIGMLALIGLSCCFITAVTLLPALLQVLEKRA